MSKKILVADLGNTSLKIGFADELALGESYTLSTHSIYTADSLGLTLHSLLRQQDLRKSDLAACLYCSVVPELDGPFQQACGRFLGVKALRFPTDFKINIENRYESPSEVGSDRLLAAYAARALYPEPKSLISVDFGTATTFDCVTDMAYLGGLICPGVLSSLRALATGTAKLPRISLEVREDVPLGRLIGRNTATSLNHGFVFGFAAMVQGLCAKLEEQLPGPVQTIATGGFARDVARVWPGLNHLRPDLILEGLRLAWINNHI